MSTQGLPPAPGGGLTSAAGISGGSHDQSVSVLTKGNFEVGGVQRTNVILDVADATLISSVESITTEEMASFVSQIESVQTSDILALIGSLFDFQGFDPIQIIKRLLAISKYYRTKNTSPPETDEILKQDIMMMVCANIMMGNLQMRSVGRRSEKGRMALEYLVSKYKLKLGSTGAGMPSTVLTIPRVASSFPVITCRAAQALPEKTLSKAPFGSNAIPKFMKVQAFASFCSEDMEMRTRILLLRVVCAHSCDQTITVFEGEKRKATSKAVMTSMLPEDAWAQQWNFVEVASNSPVPSNDMKRAMMTEFKVDSIYDRISPVFQKTITVLGDGPEPVSKAQFEQDVKEFISGKKQGAITAS